MNIYKLFDDMGISFSKKTCHMVAVFCHCIISVLFFKLILLSNKRTLHTIEIRGFSSFLW